MKKQDIADALTKWWQSKDTCSGSPHCWNDDCDLCTTCFQELCNALGCKWNQDNKGDAVWVKKEKVK